MSGRKGVAVASRQGGYYAHRTRRRRDEEEGPSDSDGDESPKSVRFAAGSARSTFSRGARSSKYHANESGNGRPRITLATVLTTSIAICFLGILNLTLKLQSRAVSINECLRKSENSRFTLDAERQKLASTRTATADMEREKATLKTEVEMVSNKLLKMLNTKASLKLELEMMIQKYMQLVSQKSALQQEYKGTRLEAADLDRKSEALEKMLQETHAGLMSLDEAFNTAAGVSQTDGT